MATDIFIKTWSGDIKWLGYCLESIWKYASGIGEVIIAADVSCINDVYLLAGDAIVMPVPDWRNGYIQQQWVKINADQHTAADQILFVDSDCVFHSQFSPESFMRDGKPILMKTRYGNLGGAEVWKKITEKLCGWTVEFEYMRRLPWMYRSESLKNLRAAYPDLESHLRSMKDRSFSEFNVLGAFIDRFESDKYFVTDTEEWAPESVAKQYWSWGGISREIKREIEGHIGTP